MSKTVFFDLGNVLLFFSHARMVRQIADRCQIDERDVERIIFLEGLGDRYETGLVSSKEVYEHFFKLSNKQTALDAFLQAVGDIFEPNAALFPIVEALKAKGVRLVLLSNTNEAHFHFAYTHYPVLHLFDAYALSFEIKAMKPSPNIYEGALLLANCPRENCFFIDDLEGNVQAARQCGIDSELYIGPEKLIEHLQARNLL